MQVVLLIATLFDMHYVVTAGGAAASRGAQQYQQQQQQQQANRILLIATALIGGILAIFFKSAVVLATMNSNKYYTSFISHNYFDTDALWLALLSQQFYFRALDKKKTTDDHKSSSDHNNKSKDKNDSKHHHSKKNTTGTSKQSTTTILASPSPSSPNTPLAHTLTHYDWTKSTAENYKATTTSSTSSSHPSAPRNYGKYASVRDTLDLEFHGYYTKQRQQFQDRIIDSLLHIPRAHTVNNNSSGGAVATNCSQPREPWIVFTAGAMGAGKSHTIKVLDLKRRFPLHAFIQVDPDVVRHLLPEFGVYASKAPLKAGELTRKECGMMSEILTKVALQRGRNVLVDGSLRNATWYEEYFRQLRVDYPRLKIGIIHVTAPRAEVFQRALERSKTSGRVVPHELLERTMIEVPRSVQRLSPIVDFAVEIYNGVTNHIPAATCHECNSTTATTTMSNPQEAAAADAFCTPTTKSESETQSFQGFDANADVEIHTPGMTWESFKNHWRHYVCPHT